MRHLLFVGLLTVSAASLGACTRTERTLTGAAIGGAVGGVAGGVLTGSALGVGAGAAAGAAVGGVIGNATSGPRRRGSYED